MTKPKANPGSEEPQAQDRRMGHPGTREILRCAQNDNQGMTKPKANPGSQKPHAQNRRVGHPARKVSGRRTTGGKIPRAKPGTWGTQLGKFFLEESQDERPHAKTRHMGHPAREVSVRGITGRKTRRAKPARGAPSAGWEGDPGLKWLCLAARPGRHTPGRVDTRRNRHRIGAKDARRRVTSGARRRLSRS